MEFKKNADKKSAQLDPDAAFDYVKWPTWVQNVDPAPVGIREDDDGGDLCIQFVIHSMSGQ